MLIGASLAGSRVVIAAVAEIVSRWRSSVTALWVFAIPRIAVVRNSPSLPLPGAPSPGVLGGVGSSGSSPRLRQHSLSGGSGQIEKQVSAVIRGDSAPQVDRSRGPEFGSCRGVVSVMAEETVKPLVVHR